MDERIKTKRLHFDDSMTKSIFILLTSFAVSHFIFLVLFALLKISEMFVYNIFSVTFFAIMATLVYARKDVDLMKIDIIIAVELITHQLLAIYFVGLEAGFQYIFIAMAAPLVCYTYDKKYKTITYVKSGIAFGCFLLTAILPYTKFKPFYTFKDSACVRFFKFYIMFVVFYTISRATFATYKRFVDKIQEEYGMYKNELNKQIKVQNGIIEMVANLIEARDEDTGHHTERTSRYVNEILKRLKEKDKYKDFLTDQYIKDVTTAATLHDIGKIKISDTILNKPGRLTDEEYNIIKTHTTEGAKIISMCSNIIEDKDYLKIAREIALYHHERIDGKGYPTGISGETIPFHARVMAVADVYDALTNKRVYKESFDKDVAINILRDGRGTQFDPEILDTFIEYIQEEDK